MKVVINHPTYGEIVYSESFWTGKRSLTVNGVNASPLSKEAFSFDGVTAHIHGNMFTGETMSINNETLELIPKPTWYEVLFSAFPVLFLLTWGNVPTLCAIFPVVGGALGGAIGAGAGCTSLFLMRKTKDPVYKILIGLGVGALGLFAAYILAICLLSLLA